MRLIGVTVVRNEADIFESSARANLHVLDELYVLLHRARDGTDEIAAALRREGLKLRLFADQREGFHQDASINSLARRAFQEGNADFVFPIDGDEILQVADRPALETSLSALPSRTGGLMRWQTYVCSVADDATELCPTRRITYRYDLGPDWNAAIPVGIDAEYCKVFVGRWFHEQPSAWIYEGNHAVFCDGKLAVTPCPGVEIAHFPVRSLDQLSQKVSLGWLSCVASGRDPEKKGIALHWKRMFEQLRDNGPLSWEDAARFVEAYIPPERRSFPLVSAPIVDHVGSIRYAGLQRSRDLTAALLEFGERLARDQASK